MPGEIQYDPKATYDLNNSNIEGVEQVKYFDVSKAYLPYFSIRD